MNKPTLRIGVVGYSRNSFDQQAAQALLEEALSVLKARHPQREIEIVSGYTNAGVPKLAYEIAERLGMRTVGFSAQQALRVRSGVFAVDKVILEGERFGDESAAFVRYIDGLIRVGGGVQSRREVRLFKALHRDKPLDRILQEYEVDWYGKGAQPIHQIKGLTYLEHFISPQKERQLLALIDAQPWSEELSRRVQHYGYQYDYRSRSIRSDMKVQDLPAWTNHLKKKIDAEGLMPDEADQMIINEYLPGQGIADHIDCESCFGEVVLSLSLGSPTIMQFTEGSSQQKIELLLQPQSLVALEGAARYQWKHGIPARKSDLIHGSRKARGRRVSLTFRKVVLS